MMLAVAAVLADLPEGLRWDFIGFNRCHGTTPRARVEVRLGGELHCSLVLLEVLRCRHFNYQVSECFNDVEFLF